MGAEACPARSRARIQAEFIPLQQSLLYSLSPQSTVGSILSMPLHSWLLPKTAFGCYAVRAGRDPGPVLAPVLPEFRIWVKSFTNQVKSQHHHRESEHRRLPRCRLPLCRRRLPGRESLLGEQWNVVVVTHIQQMQTKWSEITSCKTLIQHKSDREQMRPLAASSMTSPMDARGHYQ
jgi:hypothetical protein